MERMKISKHTILLFLITIFLFITPFFWLKPGEMDLGGDSSRLYFYDPVKYLLSSTLYSISASAFGLETIYYFNIPLVSLFIVLKSVLVSPTLLISVFHGFSMSMAFIFCYLVIKELIIGENSINKSSRVYYSAILGGLTYILSPALIDGWEHVLTPHNQIFLNPLLFYLLLKYFKTSNIKFIFIILLITFIFSPSFSVIATPALFSFYPLGILFLLIYTKFIIKRKIVIKHLLLGILLFLGIQAFHLIPHITSILTPGSDINDTVFSAEKKLIRGLGFFSAVAPNIKASINLLGFPQNKLFNLFAGIFIIFPFLMVVSLIFNRKKTIILTAFFFLIVLFFATANITNIWLEIYKLIFYIPGFSMFRNFYGQWQFAYVFFYSILFGQALYIILSKLNKAYTYLLLFFLVLILIINAMPLVTGELVRRPLWQSKEVVEVMEMDPDYEKALSFVSSLPSDAKVLTLPITDPGYQIVAGKNGGAYMGPSTIAYLAGKKDFAGLEEFDKYKDVILNFMKDKEFEKLRRLLGIFNIKYIFYNADPKVYEDFPGFPYLYVRKFLPQDQNSYKELVASLGFNQIKNINNKFFIFELQDDNYLPQIYVAKKTQYFNKQFTEINVPLSMDSQESRIAVDNNYQPIPRDYQIKFDEILTDVQGKNSFLDFFVNADYSVGFPYAFSAWPTNSLVYPLVVFRENLQLSKFKRIDDIYIETAILIADKRIGELERWGAPILGNIKSIDTFDQSWKEPSMWDGFIKRNQYNAWEVGFLRYKREIYNLINKIEKPNNSQYSPTANKEKLKKAVIADRERFYIIIEKDEKLSKKEKIYLLKLCIKMFDSIKGHLQLEIPVPSEIPYDLSNLKEGEYEVFIDKKSVEKVDQSKWQIVINGRKLYLKDFREDSNWYKGQNITVKDGENKILTLLSSQSTNLLSDDQWRLFEEKGLGENYASLAIEDGDLPDSNGLIKKISGWSPRSYYVLSFEYLTHGKSFKVIIYDKSLQKNSNFRKVFKEDLRSSQWKQYRTIFQSSNDAYLALLQILKSEGGLIDQIETKEKNSKIEIRNLSVIGVSNPKIILKKVIKSDSQNIAIPKITFTKINPTKYEIDVNNATSPYTLVFTEAFNDKWKLVDLDSKTNTASIRGYLSRLSASIANMIGNVFRIEEEKASGTISYFGGDVKENYSKNIFLDGNTFNAWGKNEIAPYRHFAVNGYSNAWYIKPEDFGGKTEYTLILEMVTQKLFYRSLVISIFAVIICMVLLIRSLIKKNYLNEKFT